MPIRRLWIRSRPNLSPTTLLHGDTSYDQLFGLDASFHPQPQMLAGHHTNSNGTLRELILREKLMFHDNTPMSSRPIASQVSCVGRDTTPVRQLWQRQQQPGHDKHHAED